MSDDNAVDQSSASAAGDVTGRDKITNIYRYRRSKLETLIAALRTDQSKHGDDAAPNETLQYYNQAVSDDGIVGLEAKLEAAGRSAQISKAIRQKEEFRKLLEAWAHSETAQTVFAELLSKVENKYNFSIYAKKDDLTSAEIDALVYTEIVETLNEQVGENPLGLCELTIAGMLFWLAERCHIKWH